MVIEFYCFFDNVSDYLSASFESIFNVNATQMKDFIIQEPIRCKDKVFRVRSGSTWFCFLLWIGIRFVKENSSEIVNDFINQIKNYKLFLDEKKNNFICSAEGLKKEIEEKGIFFDDFVELVKYCYSKNLIDMRSLSKERKKDIEEIAVMEKWPKSV